VGFCISSGSLAWAKEVKTKSSPRDKAENINFFIEVHPSER
jgi:hypothetical protein